MSLKVILKRLKENYVINQAQKAKLPEFKSDEICRQRITFSGRVQNVGFRLEVVELAKRLGLTGYCDNLENGDVIAELQGAPDKIDFLVSFMEGLKRVKVTDKIVEELELVENETDFTSERKRT